ncbi:MAG TPA: hypothetical protein VHQ22_20095 [Terriglobales bacterium]|nr:hypothetical protein [Terriglobales bacterium]
MAILALGFLVCSHIARQREKIGTLEHEKISLLQREITRLEQELELSRKREVEARIEGIQTGQEKACGSIKILMTTKHRILDDRLLSKVTERANLFLVVAGGEIKAGYLGEEAMTEDQLKKVLDTMKVVSDIVGCSASSIVTKSIEKLVHGRQDN